MEKDNLKKVVVMLSTVFQKGHPKEGKPTGFKESFLQGRKIHTLRLDAKGKWAKDIKDVSEGRKFISVRQWTGRPYNSEQIEIGQLTEGENAHGMGLQHFALKWSKVGGKVVASMSVDGHLIPISEVAAHDGLSEADFLAMFTDNKKDEGCTQGVVIHFTNFRYGNDKG